MKPQENQNDSYLVQDVHLLSVPLAQLQIFGMKAILLSLVGLFLAGVPTCKVKDVKSDAKPITHELFTAELQKYVSEDGWVDYDAWSKDTVGLQNYIELVSTHYPDDKTWTRDQQLAYWLNAYNAYTIKLMLEHWPVGSIKDIKKGIGFVNSVWDIEWINIQGTVYSLNNLEHGIIRPKFHDQRVHMAANCASVSCPQMRNKAYTAENLNDELDEQARLFFKSFRNDLSDLNKPVISPIFKWYGSDFEWNKSSLKEFVEKHGEVTLPDGYKFEFMDYNWSTNSVADKQQ